MKVFIKIAAFLVLFVLFLLWRFPYGSLVERAVRQAELATGSTILYQLGSAGPFGVKVKDLNIRTQSGAALQFDMARIFPTRHGLTATAYQGENEMKIDFNGSVLELELDDINVQTGNVDIGTARATGDMTFAVRTREGKGTIGLDIPEIGLPIPLQDRHVNLGSTFVIRNTGTPELPRTGISVDLKIISSDGSSSATGPISLEGQAPPNSPLLNGTLRYETPNARGTLRLSGTWDKPVKTVVRK